MQALWIGESNTLWRTDFTHLEKVTIRGSGRQQAPTHPAWWALQPLSQACCTVVAPLQAHTPCCLPVQEPSYVLLNVLPGLEPPVEVSSTALYPEAEHCIPPLARMHPL